MAQVYKITNTVNGKSYIGKTIGEYKRRFAEHLSEAKLIRSSNRPLYKAINKYGAAVFTIELIEDRISEEVCCDREIYWIEFYGTFKTGYNATFGGDSRSYVDKSNIVATYREVKSVVKVAQLLGCSVDTCRRHLRQEGVKILPTRNQIAKSVTLIGETEILFASIREATRYLQEKCGVRAKTQDVSCKIAACCKGKRKTCYGFSFRYSIVGD